MKGTNVYPGDWALSQDLKGCDIAIITATTITIATTPSPLMLPAPTLSRSEAEACIVIIQRLEVALINVLSEPLGGSKMLLPPRAASKRDRDPSKDRKSDVIVAQGRTSCKTDSSLAATAMLLPYNPSSSRLLVAADFSNHPIPLKRQESSSRQPWMPSYRFQSWDISSCLG